MKYINLELIKSIFENKKLESPKIAKYFEDSEAKINNIEENRRREYRHFPFKRSRAVLKAKMLSLFITLRVNEFLFILEDTPPKPF